MKAAFILPPISGFRLRLTSIRLSGIVDLGIGNDFRIEEVAVEGHFSLNARVGVSAIVNVVRHQGTE